MRFLVLAVLVAAAAVGGAVAYQAVAGERGYQGFLQRGDAALRDDQTFGAIEAYSGAIALRPDSMLARLRRGETYQRRGDLENAARDFRAAAALDPTATRPLEELGDVLYQMQRFHRAAEVYATCLKLDDRLSRVSYKLALARYRDGNIDDALAAATQAVRVSEGTADGYYLLGLCLRDSHRVTEARQAFEKAISLSPGLISAREELADLYASQGRYADELEQLQVIAGLDRDHVERQVVVGLAQARPGRAEPAVLTLGNALERTPDQPLVYGALGRVWLDDAEARNDRLALNKALEALARVASSPASTSDVLTLYGRALLRDGQIDLAERTLQQATTRFPVEPSAFLYYATCAERQNHLEAARQALIAYGALVGDDAELAARATRIATLSLRLNETAAAVRWLERAAAAIPADVRLLVSLADAQLRAGDRAASRSTVARGLEIDRTNAALIALARRVR